MPMRGGEQWVSDGDRMQIPKLMCIVANVMSQVACLVLLYKFCRMRSRVWHRLFPRQLWNLAFGDLVYSTATMLNYCSWAIIPPFTASEDARKNVCRGLVGSLLSGMYVSTFLEAHIAVGFACIYWRQLHLLSFLSKSMLLVWPLGVALGITQSVMSVDFAKGIDGYTACTMAAGYWEEAEALILLTMFLVSMLAYASAAYRVKRYDPDSVQRAVWKTTWVYPINFFVTYGPLILFLLPITSIFRTKLVFYVALVLEGLNGFVNAGCYALTSHYMRLRFERSSSGGIFKGIEALISGDGAPGECSPQQGSTLSEVDGGLVSFHVGFRSSSSIVTVPATQEAALIRSERDMARLGLGDGYGDSY